MAGRDEFFEAIGHTVATHETQPVDTNIVPIATAQLRFGAPVVGHCGWWWCLEKDPTSVTWSELGEALKILQRRGIDPWDKRVAWVAQRCRGAEEWISELAGFEALDVALRSSKGLVSVPRNESLLNPSTMVDRLRAKWLSELWPYLRLAAEYEADRKRGEPGKPGRPVKLHYRLAIDQAQQYDWGPDEVAAIFVLTGIAKDSLASLKRAVGALKTKLALVD